MTNQNRITLRTLFIAFVFAQSFTLPVAQAGVCDRPATPFFCQPLSVLFPKLNSCDKNILELLTSLKPQENKMGRAAFVRFLTTQRHWAYKNEFKKVLYPKLNRFAKTVQGQSEEKFLQAIFQFRKDLNPDFKAFTKGRIRIQKKDRPWRKGLTDKERYVKEYHEGSELESVKWNGNDEWYPWEDPYDLFGPRSYSETSSWDEPHSDDSEYSDSDATSERTDFFDMQRDDTWDTHEPLSIYMSEENRDEASLDQRSVLSWTSHESQPSLFEDWSTQQALRRSSGEYNLFQMIDRDDVRNRTDSPEPLRALTPSK